jgi:ribosomal protein L15E
MKRATILILITLMTIATYAQRENKKGMGGRGAVTKIEATQVPEAVKKAFTVQAPDVQWEKHEAKGKKGKSGVRYVAVYTQDGVKVRSRFSEDGTPLSSSKYMGNQKLPEAVQSAATAKYPNAKIVGGEEFKAKDGKVYYRVRLREGSSKKITTMYDADGKEVIKDKLKDELKEGEEEEEKN